MSLTCVATLSYFLVGHYYDDDRGIRRHDPHKHTGQDNSKFLCVHWRDCSGHSVGYFYFRCASHFASPFFLQTFLAEFMRIHSERRRVLVVANEEDPLALIEIYLNDALEVLTDLQIVRDKLKTDQLETASTTVTPFFCVYRPKAHKLLLLWQRLLGNELDEEGDRHSMEYATTALADTIGNKSVKDATNSETNNDEPDPSRGLSAGRLHETGSFAKPSKHSVGGGAHETKVSSTSNVWRNTKMSQSVIADDDETGGAVKSISSSDMKRPPRLSVQAATIDEDDASAASRMPGVGLIDVDNVAENDQVERQSTSWPPEWNSRSTLEADAITPSANASTANPLMRSRGASRASVGSLSMRTTDV
jgi:hypothetical protein